MEKIFEAIFKGDLQYFTSLNSIPDIDIRDKAGRTPLMNAVIDKRLTIIKILIEKGAKFDLQDSLGYTALHYAAQDYLVDEAKVLLENKATVDIQDVHGNTALSRAVFDSSGRGELIKLLLSNGADRNLKNKHGVSPLDLANTIANYDVKQFFG